MRILYFGEKPEPSFLGLLTWFLIFFLVGPLFPGFFGTMAIQISFSIMLLVTVFTLSNSKKAMIIGAVLALVSSSANSYNLYLDNFWTEFLALTTSLTFVTFTTVCLFRNVFLVKNVEVNLIFGAICIYVLLAIFWGLFYGLIDLLAPGSFQNIVSNADTSNLTKEVMALRFHAFLYYSFVTQTTLGYGDITPMTPLAKNYAAIQATMGVFYLAILVGGLISMLINRDRVESIISEIKKESEN